MTDLVAHRLTAQRLVGTPGESPLDLMRHFGAVQAQDFAGACWALGQRSSGATAADIGERFDAGGLLRTHVLRPTWHFVLAEDARWLLELTGPRVRRTLGGYLRAVEVDDRQVGQATEAIHAALAGGRSLTRRELGEVVRRAGIPPDGPRLGHILMAAELDGIIISGARRGKQHTYALLGERVPTSRTLDRDEALAELAQRYFQSHGPAQLRDFVWWSGLTLSDARRGVAAADHLDHAAIDGLEYWFGEAAPMHLPSETAAHLLPNWDEYTVGYRDRSAIVDADQPFDATLFAFGSILSPVVIIGGRVAGAWRRAAEGAETRIEVRPLWPLSGSERAAVRKAGMRLSRFLERSIELDGV